MNEQDPREELQAFIDHELDDERMSEIRASLARDPALARIVDELRALDSLLETLPGQELDPAFAARVAGAARATRATRARWRRPWVAVLAAACVIAAVVLTKDLIIQPKEEDWSVLVTPESSQMRDIEQLVSDIEWIDDEFLATG